MFAHDELPEDLQDVIDPKDVFYMYVETAMCPDWVQEYVLDVIHFDPSLL